MLIILSLLGFSIVIISYKFVNQFMLNKSVNYDFLISSLLLIGLFSFFVKAYVDQREVDNNLNAVYNYFGKNNVGSITINQDGEITQAEVNNKTVEITVNDGNVVEIIN